MIFLIIFSFLAGIVTILSPCILPILPIILSSTTDSSGKKRPLGVVVGFVASFTFFTLFLSSIVRVIGISADSLRFLSIFILGLFGLSLLFPQFQIFIEKLFNKLVTFVPTNTKKQGFTGGVIIGFSLGLLWTPCVGPILASVISLAVSGTVTSQAIFITLAYSMGTAIPMFMIMQFGSKALQKVPWLLENTNRIQEFFGVLMIATAIGIFFNLDRRFQTFVLTSLPNYGVGLTIFEDNEVVNQELDKINQKQESGSGMKNSIKDSLSNLVDKKGPAAPEIVSQGEWFNSQPLKLSELRGKVVLIDFWTYSCINCQRTFPYLRSWWDKYEDQGLVIIGVHSPEFEFEKNSKNVAKSIEDFQIKYPVVQDNDFDTWRAYSNRYWPAKYLIDQEGIIRYTHFGEGDYDQTEQMIQKLLKETSDEISLEKISNPKYRTYSRTHETYLGYARIDSFASPEQVVKDIELKYTKPLNLAKNSFSIEGTVTFTEEYMAPTAGAKLHLNFESKEVFLVARTKSENESAQIRVSIEGGMEGEIEFLGEDVKDGIVTIDSDKLYKIINLSEPGRHNLQLEFLDGNIEVYAFTFG